MKRLLQIALLLLVGIPAWGTITRVQNAWTGVVAAASVGSITLAAPPTAGNQIVVLVFSYFSISGGLGTFTVSDNAGNTYTRAAFHDNGGTSVGYCAIYYAENITSHSPFVVNFTASGNWYGGAEAIEYSGLNSSSTLDVTANNDASGASYTSTSATTTNTNDLLIGAHLISSTSATATPTNSFTTIVMRVAGFNEMQEQEQIVSSTGSYASTGNLSASNEVNSVFASFKGPGGGPPPPSCSNFISLLGAGCK